MTVANGQDFKTACLTPATARKNPSLDDSKEVSRADVGQADLTGFVLGHYALGAHLGTGGMGVVYAAKHRHLGKSFAVKFIRNDLHSSEAVARFLGEITTLGCLQHPNLINAVDAGVEQNLPYCVIELLDGNDLARWITSRGLMPIEAAAEVIAQALCGIAYAHSRGIIHRDLKPSNLFLQHDGSVRVLDFGLCLSDNNDTAATQSGQVLGTIDFMSPEQIRNSHLANESSDIYALAATMLYLVCGQPPYPSTKYPSAINKLRAIGREVPVGLEPETTALIPKPLHELLLRCLDAEPCNRPKTAEKLRMELQKFASPNALAAWMSGKKASSVNTASQSKTIAKLQPNRLQRHRRLMAILAVVLLIAVCCFGRHLRKTHLNGVQVEITNPFVPKLVSTNASGPQTNVDSTAPARQTINPNVSKNLNANAIGISLDSSRTNRPSSDRDHAKALQQSNTEELNQP